MFRDKVKVTPGEEQVCDYCQFCSGEKSFFLVQESLEATMPQWRDQANSAYRGQCGIVGKEPAVRAFGFSSA